jgi:hypothetical protein
MKRYIVRDVIMHIDREAMLSVRNLAVVIQYNHEATEFSTTGIHI